MFFIKDQSTLTIVIQPSIIKNRYLQTEVGLINSKQRFIARYRECDGQPQYLDDHLINVAERSKENAAKIGLSATGELLGLVHDTGKNSREFLEYLQHQVGIIEKLNFKIPGGKLDHATAGAQILYEAFRSSEGKPNCTADILAMVIASHHGLMDAITPDGVDTLGKRLAKSEEETRKEQVLKNLSPNLKKRLDNLLASDIEGELNNFFDQLFPPGEKADEAFFKSGLLVRYLLSSLIDADWSDAAKHDSFGKDKKADKINWSVFIEHLEDHLSELQTKAQNDPSQKDVNLLRNDVSKSCLESSSKEQGIFRLNVPTGGGKTLASLRFALHHAEKHNLDRIFYVIPYTSIIDQNADSIRKALQIEKSDLHILLEHHSNLTPDKDLSREEQEEKDYHYRTLAENWTSPIILTTMVQFLETLFGSGTRSCRRMHQLANSVIIFDEIQTLPLNMLELFNLAAQFLVDGCGSSMMLCTATQPLLHQLDNPARSLSFDDDKQILVSHEHKIRSLQRVQIFDQTRPEGWSSQEIAGLIFDECSFEKSVLVIVNTKKQASNIYNLLKGTNNVPILHLSTSMCPEHRRNEIENVNELLEKKQPLILISTQLIEAGVDVDFDVVIRSITGMDSIAQAAGRCNRNGSKEEGRVILINPTEENLSKLPEIFTAKQITERILSDFIEGEIKNTPSHLLSESIIERYFQLYYHEFRGRMNYPVDHKSPVGRTDNLVSLLGINSTTFHAYNRVSKNAPINRFLLQSFRTASQSFCVIPNIGHGIIVPYGEGKEIITELSGVFKPEKHFDILREAQRFSVNCFQHELVTLSKEGAIYEVQSGAGIFYLQDSYYHDRLGLTLSRSQLLPTLGY